MKKIVLSVIFVSTLLWSYSIEFDKNTECYVRHLKIYKAPAWVAKINLSNGKEIFFSSPKSMFEFYFRQAKWPQFNIKSEDDFKDIIITDFKTLKPADARGAFFVYGSNVISPGGDDLVAFSSYENAKEFSKKHNGKRILSFKEISDALIRLINGRI